MWSQGVLKLFAGLDVQFTLTTKSSDSEDDMAELYAVRVRKGDGNRDLTPMWLCSHSFIERKRLGWC